MQNELLTVYHPKPAGRLQLVGDLTSTANPAVFVFGCMPPAIKEVGVVYIDTSGNRTTFGRIFRLSSGFESLSLSCRRWRIVVVAKS